MEEQRSGKERVKKAGNIVNKGDPVHKTITEMEIQSHDNRRKDQRIAENYLTQNIKQQYRLNIEKSLEKSL